MGHPTSQTEDFALGAPESMQEVKQQAENLEAGGLAQTSLN